MSNQIISIDRSESSPTEPLILAQVKSHLIITSTDDDTMLTALITQCRKAVENFCHISIAFQTITAYLILGEGWLELPYGPSIGLAGVSTSAPNIGSGPATYDTQTSGWQTDGGTFQLFTGTCGLRYRLVYTAGYSTVPDDLKLAILNEIAYRYENRGEVGDKILDGLCAPARILAIPYKRMLWQ